MLNIKWPNKISNNKLYEACNVKEPLSLHAARLRWSLFGHILRLDPEVPAKKAMMYYCSQKHGPRGRPKTTLPTILWAEARPILGRNPTINNFIDLAQDRDKWRGFTKDVLDEVYKKTGSHELCVLKPRQSNLAPGAKEATRHMSWQKRLT